jgi:hypothetical protein
MKGRLMALWEEGKEEEEEEEEDGVRWYTPGGKGSV